MKAGLAKDTGAGGCGQACLQCRRVIKAGQATLSQTRQVGYNYGRATYQATDYWHRACIEGLLKKSEEKMKGAVEVATPEKLEDKFNALREQLATGASSLIA